MIRIAALCSVLAVVAAGPVMAQQQAADRSRDWWRTGVCYEVFVRSFSDSDGDGIGDLRGLTGKLSYINDGDPASQRDLGASCIWLMPIAQSPSYHGYDVTNYYEINRDYGSTEDFKQLVAEAHRRGIRVLVDLVLNHMSSEHPYFQSALADRNSPYRDWFLWSPTRRRAAGWQAEVWHRAPDREDYYFGLFWHGMPDLNLGNPAVGAETRRIARYWLEEMGVDGFRFDAVNHFFESGDTVRNGAATHPWLREYSAWIHQIAPRAFTVGELWDSLPGLRPYYPDQLDSYFNREVSDAILEAVRRSSARGLLSIVERSQRELPRGRWASFVRNHDQTRTMTELGGDTPRAKLAMTLLLTLPGIPFIYYGEEIGMTGAKPDPRIRTPMQWARRPGGGFTSGQAWEPFQPDSFTVTVEAQDADTSSLLNHVRRLVHLRTARPSLGAASLFTPLVSGSDSVIAYRRGEGADAIVVVANLGGRSVTTRTWGTLAPYETMVR